MGLAQPVPLNLPGESRDFVTVGELLYFTAGNGTLLRTDGTEAGTVLLKTGFNYDPAGVREFKGMAVLLDGNGTLWKSDGTPSGTIPLTSPSQSDVQILESTSKYLFFQARDVAAGLELFRTDGTTQGTALVKDVNPGTSDGFKGSFKVVGDQLIFSGDNGINGTELWKTDGTENAMVKDVNPGGEGGIKQFLSTVGTDLFFVGDNGIDGGELWKTDGSAEGTMMVQDINPGAGDGVTGESFSFDNKLYFKGFTTHDGWEPWVSDGTDNGTMMLQDVSPGADGSKIDFILANNGLVYFSSTPMNININPVELNLWATDGTPGSTIKLKTVCKDCRFDSDFIVYKEKMYFFVNETLSEILWETDGTAEGTRTIFSEFLDGTIPFFEEVNGYIFFYTTSQGNNIALHSIDAEGTRDGISRPFNFGNAGGRQIAIASVGDLVFFADHDSPQNSAGGGPLNPEDEFQLFQTDGSTVTSLRNMFGISFQGTQDILDYNGKVLFSTQREETDQKQWWIYDPHEPLESFTLVDADTEEDIQTLSPGDTISIGRNKHYNIRYNPQWRPASVVFEQDGRTARTESQEPFSLAGDRNGDYFPWYGATPGNHTVKATGYTGSNGTGTAGPTRAVTFTIISEEKAALFTLVNADTDEDIQKLNDGDVFVKPANMNINIRYDPVSTPSFVIFKHNDIRVRIESAAPYSLAGDRSGNYIPWTNAVAGSHKVEASYTSGETTISDAVTFTIEDDVEGSAAARLSLQTAIYPNPSTAGHPELTIAGYEGIDAPVETEIKIMSMTGEIVFDRTILCGGGCAEYVLKVNGALPPGLYMVNMETNGVRYSKRLLVE